eukprot:Sspe_Gene.80294::Locus_50596_Transcript_1_1_Confidence_1.000_Length_1346::g.80294::m.80294
MSGWVGWAGGAVRNYMAGFTHSARATMAAQDAMYDLSMVCTRLETVEHEVARLREEIADFAVAPHESSEVVEGKQMLLRRWEKAEDALLALARDLQCIVADSASAEEQRVVRLFTSRIDAALDAGSAAVSSLSAVRAVRPDLPAWYCTDAMMDSISRLECEETKCRAEYTAAELRLREAIADRHRSERPRCGLVVKAVKESRSWEDTMPTRTAIDHAPFTAAFAAVGKVVRVERLRNPRRWKEYVAMRGMVGGERGRTVVTTMTDLTPPPLPTGADDLVDSANEKYLFLPCPPSCDVFSSLGALKRSRGLFGPGLYLSETVERADAQNGGLEPAILIVRVTLGKVDVVPHPAPSRPTSLSHTILAPCRNPPSTLLAPPKDPTAWLDAHREFVVNDPSLCYPEFMVRYVRK